MDSRFSDLTTLRSLAHFPACRGELLRRVLRRVVQFSDFILQAANLGGSCGAPFFFDPPAVPGRALADPGRFALAVPGLEAFRPPCSAAGCI